MDLSRKKVKTRPYSILIQKSKGSNAFYEQIVKNIDYNRFFPTLRVGYRYQNIFLLSDTIIVTALAAETNSLGPFSIRKYAKTSVFYVKTSIIHWRLGAMLPDPLIL